MEVSRAVERNTLVTAIVLLGFSIVGNILLFSNTRYLRIQANDALLKTDSMLSVKLLLEKKIDKGKTDLLISKEQIQRLKKQLVTIRDEQSRMDYSLQLLRRDTSGLKTLQKENMLLAALYTKNGERSKQLQEEKSAIEKELKTLQTDNTNLRSRTVELEKQLVWAKELRTQIISYENVKLRRNNPEQTLKAKKVNRLSVIFELEENPVAETGIRNIYLVLYDTQGKILSTGGKKFFNKKQNKEIAYTAMQKVHYNNKKQRLNMSVDYDAKLCKGRYSFELYIDGNHSSRNEFALQ